MKVLLTLWLGGLCLLYQGCMPIGRAIRTSLVQPTEYNTYVNCATEVARDRLLAREALEHFEGEHAGVPYSRDFRCGFKDGYADYLFAGGTGNPPPVPPRCYWNACYQTPEGHQAIEDWFAGFQAGAAAAKASGKRELVTVPASTALPPSDPPPQLPPPPPPPSLPVSPQTTPEEVLPPPKPLPGREG